MAVVPTHFVQILPPLVFSLYSCYYFLIKYMKSNMLFKLVSHYNLKKLYLVKQQFQKNVLLVGSDLIYQNATKLFLVITFVLKNSSSELFSILKAIVQ